MHADDCRLMTENKAIRWCVGHDRDGDFGQGNTSSGMNIHGQDDEVSFFSYMHEQARLIVAGLCGMVIMAEVSCVAGERYVMPNLSFS